MQVRSWLDSVGDAYMSKKDLGDSLDSAYSLQEECLNVEAQLMVSILGRYSSSCLLPLLTTKFLSTEFGMLYFSGGNMCYFPMNNIARNAV